MIIDTEPLQCSFERDIEYILPVTQEKGITPSREQQEVTPDNGYTGLSKVTVEAVTNEIDSNIQPNNIKLGVNILGVDGNLEPDKPDQTKTITPTEETQTIKPDTGYELAEVTVEAIPSEYVIPTGTLDITSNGTYDVTNYESANVNVQPTLQEKTQTITVNGSYIFEPDNDYYGLNKVIANVNVPTKTLGTKTIAENGTYKASDDGVDGYSEVNVQVKGTEPQFTGHYDKIGLKTIGWSDEEINYYQKNGVQWNSTEDEYFKLTDTELAGDDSKNTRFLPKNTTKKYFRDYYGLLAIPLLDTSKVTNMSQMFINCASLTTIPQLDTSNVTNMESMFNGCSSLTAIPQLDTSKVTNMASMFVSCRSLKTIPLLDTSKVNSFGGMFSGCSSLMTIPQLDTSEVTTMSSMFNACTALKTIPLLNTSKVTNTGYMFNGCSSLTAIPQLDTSKVTNMASMFVSCRSLKTIPLLDTSKVTNIESMLNGCSLLTDFGGLENLGQAYSTIVSANNSNYKINLSNCIALTEQSLINVLNNLYDIATKGCNVQQVVLGSTNLAKLTSVEGQQALAQAQQFGWNVS